MNFNGHVEVYAGLLVTSICQIRHEELELDILLRVKST
jgi:hypothetical protein